MKSFYTDAILNGKSCRLTWYRTPVLSVDAPCIHCRTPNYKTAWQVIGTGYHTTHIMCDECGRAHWNDQQELLQEINKHLNYNS